MCEQEEEITKLVLGIRCNHKRMRGKKLYGLLSDKIHHCKSVMGRDKFFDLLRRRDLLVKRRRKYAVTTQSRHRFRVHQNLVKDYTPQEPHRVWVSDITYIRTGNGFKYLFLITDAYSRKVVGWELSSSLGLAGALKSLKMALKQCSTPTGLIHHSDRGFQYCSHEYVKRIESNGGRMSMGEAGNCYDNATAERVNGILKDEYGLDEHFKEEQHALRTVREAIFLYNEQRPHWSLGLKTPSQVHES